MGGAGRAAEGRQVDVREARAARDPPRRHAFQLQWMWKMLQNCTPERYAVNKGRMVRLAEYSRDCLQALRADTGIDYEGRTGGTLQVFRTQQQLDGAAKDIAVLKDANVPFELLSPAELASAEPALAAVSHKLTGGLRLPERRNRRLPEIHHAPRRDGRSARREVPLQHADRRARHGERPYRRRAMRQRNGARAIRLSWRSARIRRNCSAGLVKIPVYPLKGYSITAPIVNAGVRAGFHRARRDLQDRDHAFRRPDSRRRHGRDRRLRQALKSGAPRNARNVRERPVPRRRRHDEGYRSGPVCAR